MPPTFILKPQLLNKSSGLLVVGSFEEIMYVEHVC